MAGRGQNEGRDHALASEDFFRRDDVRRALARAHIVAQTPLSVHKLSQRAARANTYTQGNCEACKYVSRLPWGKQACHNSREKAARSAVMRDKTIPFLCHMGFSCVTVALPAAHDEKVAITLGPFCPDETPDSLDVDAMRGLHALSHKNVKTLPFSLDDIPRVSAKSMPNIAEWLRDTLSTLADAVEDDPTPARVDEPRIENAPAGRKALRDRPVRDAYQSADIAATLMSGKQDQARRLIQRQIAEAAVTGRLSISLKRARVIAVVSATLEAAERAGVVTESCLERFTSFLDSAHKADNDRTLSRAAMKILGELKPKAAKHETEEDLLVLLNRIVAERPPQGLRLQDVAAILGVHPTTITHRLQRKFGMSFSEYIGRVRVDAAKELLQRTRLSVSAIARRSGLNDSANFSRLFRKFEGISPTAYRKRHQGGLSPTLSRRNTR